MKYIINMRTSSNVLMVEKVDLTLPEVLARVEEIKEDIEIEDVWMEQEEMPKRS